jgi:glutamate/aspartate transport system substrate-binding protein
MSTAARKGAVVVLALSILGAAAGPAGAETTLEKIGRTGTLVVGTRTGSPPFGFIDRENHWVGFSVDLARLVHAGAQKKLGKPVKLELKESTPATRIPLLTSGAVDLIAGTMTVTRARRESVDFSLVFFVTGAQFLVKKGSPIKGLRDVAGRKIGAQQGSTNEKVLREKQPQAQLLVFPDQPVAFTALVQGKIDAYTNDGVQLAGLKARAPNPAEWEVVGEFYTYEPYGMAMRKNDSDFRNLVDLTLMEAIERGEYQKLYDRWFGPKGEVPYPLSESAQIFLQLQVVPR